MNHGLGRLRTDRSGYGPVSVSPLRHDEGSIDQVQVALVTGARRTPSGNRIRTDYQCSGGGSPLRRHWLWMPVLWGRESNSARRGAQSTHRRGSSQPRSSRSSLRRNARTSASMRFLWASTFSRLTVCSARKSPRFIAMSLILRSACAGCRRLPHLLTKSRS